MTAAQDKIAPGQSNGQTYGDYLHLRALLDCQHPRSGNHDELLFIILHQTMELWMKQVIHEVAAAQIEVRSGARVVRVVGSERDANTSSASDAMPTPSSRTRLPEAGRASLKAQLKAGARRPISKKGPTGTNGRVGSP